ncbi:hypothetical protein H9L39_18791 [Fusarium oxysporum f. sp. albedinis]|nr:hypothetical protein H9L39_18791 [Fusarium oxysporum f. sp. albedinis]
MVTEPSQTHPRLKANASGRETGASDNSRDNKSWFVRSVLLTPGSAWSTLPMIWCLLEDVSCNGPRPVGNPISLPTPQVVASAPTSAMTIFGGAIPPVCLNEQPLSHSTAYYTPDARAAPSLSSQLTGTGHGAEQVAAHIDAPPTRTFSPMRQAAFPETRSPRGCTPESTRALTRLRVQKYLNPANIIPKRMTSQTR